MKRSGKSIRKTPVQGQESEGPKKGMELGHNVLGWYPRVNSTREVRVTSNSCESYPEGGYAYDGTYSGLRVVPKPVETVTRSLFSTRVHTKIIRRGTESRGSSLQKTLG